MRGALVVSCLSIGCLAAIPVAASEQPMIGAPAPAFALESLAGETVALEDFRGTIVVLHFGAGW